MHILGLTDPKGKVIYISDNAPPEEAHETLLHEFLHMRGQHNHNEDFAKAEVKLRQLSIKKRIFWRPVEGE